jgi:hypothetical protein
MTSITIMCEIARLIRITPGPEMCVFAIIL